MRTTKIAPNNLNKGLVLAVGLFSVSALNANVLLSWDAGSVTTAPFAATTVAGNIQGTPSLSGGSGVVFDVGGTSGNYEASTTDPATVTWASTEAGSLTAEQYLTFTVQADSGYQLNLNGGSFEFAWDPSGNAGTRVDKVGLFSSVEGFSAGAGIGYIDTATDSPWAARTSVFNISGAQYDGLTGAVEFRLYLWNGGTPATPAASQALAGISNLNGAVVAVPEPSVFALLGGLGALGMVLYRRRKR